MPAQMDLVSACLHALMDEHGDRIGPRTVLAAAADPASPLHDRFEWDDSKAGEQVRLAQASQLIRQWKGTVVRVHREPTVIEIKPARAVESPRSERGRGLDSYSATERILADPARRDDLIRTALAELAGARRRYASLVALSDVWAAIDDALELHSPVATRQRAEARPEA